MTKADKELLAGLIGCGVILAAIIIALLLFLWPSSKAPPASVVRADGLTFYHEVNEAMAPCDASGSISAKVAAQIDKGKAGFVDGYAASKRQAEACQASWSAIRDMSLPDSFTGTLAAQAGKALEACSGAASAKGAAGETAEAIYNGDVKPSKLVELQDRNDAMEASAAECAVGLMATARTAGIDPKTLGN